MQITLSFLEMRDFPCYKRSSAGSLIGLKYLSIKRMTGLNLIFYDFMTSYKNKRVLRSAEPTQLEINELFVGGILM